ncbi:MAG: CHRD domain-containing protein [Candidatus Binataceae bacterium]
MKGQWLWSGLLVTLIFVLNCSRAFADPHPIRSYSTCLSGYNVVPPNYTTGSGTVKLWISDDNTSITYRLAYSGLSSDVIQAHIHFGQEPVNGGIIVYLCDTTGIGPGSPTCPSSGVVTGTVTAADINPTGNPASVTPQGIVEGEFAGLIGAIEHNDAYVNVHTDDFPNGEIAGWLRPGH